MGHHWSEAAKERLRLKNLATAIASDPHLCPGCGRLAKVSPSSATCASCARRRHPVVITSGSYPCEVCLGRVSFPTAAALANHLAVLHRRSA